MNTTGEQLIAVTLDQWTLVHALGIMGWTLVLCLIAFILWARQ